MENQICGCRAKDDSVVLPEQDMEMCHMQGHWLLAKMGKRVLRPGGLELTHQMLDALNITNKDEIVEFAPGLGVTAKLTLAKKPMSYIAIEREEAAANQVRCYLNGSNQTCVLGDAENTGLEDESATVVYGEAMLTMHTDKKKREIMREAARILKPGGRYGIHEVGIIPNDADDSLKKNIKKELSNAIHIGASPATMGEWQEMLEFEGFKVQTVLNEPFHLLEPKRLIQDEGLLGAMKFAKNLIIHGEACKIVLKMKKVFRQYKKDLNGMSMIAVKK